VRAQYLITKGFAHVCTKHACGALSLSLFHLQTQLACFFFMFLQQWRICVFILLRTVSATANNPGGVRDNYFLLLGLLNTKMREQHARAN